MSDSEDEAPDKQLKIVIMGDGASGKVSRPSFLSRFWKKITVTRSKESKIHCLINL